MINKRYHVVKDKEDKSITYFEYDKIEGYDISPKKNAKIEDAINVNKIVIINPTLANKVAKKKLDIKFRKLVELLNTIFESDDDTGDAYHQGLNEVEKLRQELVDKYKKHLENDEYDTMDKKLGILEHELKVRLFYIEKVKEYEAEEKENEYEQERGRRSR